MPAPGDPPEPAASTATGERRPPQAALVVDDQAELRDVAAEALASRGYDVHTARDAAQARGLELDACAVLLTDVALGDAPGTELARELRRVHAGLAVVLMSGLLDEATASAVDAGEGVFLPKPFSLAELLAAVERAVGTARP